MPAQDVSETGTVVGYHHCTTKSAVVSRPFVAQAPASPGGTVATTALDMGGYASVDAMGISPSGNWIVGYAASSKSTAILLWPRLSTGGYGPPQKVLDAGNGGAAFAVNDCGVAVGVWAYGTSTIGYAVTADRRVTNLPTLGRWNHDARAVDIDDAGTVVGWSRYSNGANGTRLVVEFRGTKWQVPLAACAAP
jgi:hypothetical protein